MTDKYAKKWSKDLKRARLTNAERSGVLAELTAFMAEHPASDEALVRRMYRGGKVFSPERKRVPIGFRFVPALLSVILAISTGGGISYAAEGSVPGEALYPVKIHINEGVKTVLAVSSADKVAWQAERVERRMKEAETLASRGELTEERSVLLADSVVKHTEALVEEINAAKESGEAFAVADMGADAAISLEGRDEVLLEITVGIGSSDDAMLQKDVSRIVDALHATEDELDLTIGDGGVPVADAKSGLVELVEVPAGMIEMTERRRTRAEEGIADSREYITNNKEQLPELVASTAGRIIRRAEDILHEGEENMELGLYSLALQRFYEAQRTAKRVTVYAESNLVFEIEISEVEPPAEEPPVVEEPPIVEEPPAEEPPVVEEPPLVEEPPAEEPPVVEEPPVTEEPLVENVPQVNEATI